MPYRATAARAAGYRFCPATRTARHTTREERIMNLHQFKGDAAASLTERLPLVPAAPELSPPHLPEAIIFNVEGTLVDSVLPTLCAWQDALADHGFCFTTSELHRCSGLGAEEMLTALLPAPVHGTVREPIARRQ